MRLRVDPTSGKTRYEPDDDELLPLADCLLCAVNHFHRRLLTPTQAWNFLLTKLQEACFDELLDARAIQAKGTDHAHQEAP